MLLLLGGVLGARVGRTSHSRVLGTVIAAQGDNWCVFGYEKERVLVLLHMAGILVQIPLELSV